MLLQNAYTNRELPFLCEISIVDGCSEFEPANSGFSKGGLKIEIKSEKISFTDKRNVSQMILSVKELLQVLATLNFHTLLVGGTENRELTAYCLADYLKYDNFTF